MKFKPIVLVWSSLLLGTRLGVVAGEDKSDTTRPRIFSPVNNDLSQVCASFLNSRNPIVGGNGYGAVSSAFPVQSYGENVGYGYGGPNTASQAVSNGYGSNYGFGESNFNGQAQAISPDSGLGNGYSGEGFQSSAGNGYGWGQSNAQGYGVGGGGYVSGETGSQGKPINLGNGYGIGGITNAQTQTGANALNSYEQSLGSGIGTGETNAYSQAQPAFAAGNVGGNNYGWGLNGQIKSVNVGDKGGIGNIENAQTQSGNNYQQNLRDGVGSEDVNANDQAQSAIIGGNFAGTSYNSGSIDQTKTANIENERGVGGITNAQTQPDLNAFNSYEQSLGSGYDTNQANAYGQGQLGIETGDFGNSNYGSVISGQPESVNVENAKTQSDINTFNDYQQSLGSGYGTSPSNAYGEGQPSIVGGDFGGSNYDSGINGQPKTTNLGNGRGIGGITNAKTQSALNTFNNNYEQGLGSGYSTKETNSNGQEQSAVVGGNFGSSNYGTSVSGKPKSLNVGNGQGIGGITNAQTQSGINTFNSNYGQSLGSSIGGGATTNGQTQKDIIDSDFESSNYGTGLSSQPKKINVERGGDSRGITNAHTQSGVNTYEHTLGSGIGTGGTNGNGRANKVIVADDFGGSNYGTGLSGKPKIINVISGKGIGGITNAQNQYSVNALNNYEQSLGSGIGSSETNANGQRQSAIVAGNFGGSSYGPGISGQPKNAHLENVYGVGGTGSPASQAYGGSNVGNGYSVSGASSNVQPQPVADNGNFGNNGYGIVQSNTHSNLASSGNSYGLGETGSPDGQATASTGAYNVGNGYGYNTAQSGVQSNVPSLGNGYGVGGISSPATQTYDSGRSSNVGNGYSVGGASSNAQLQFAADNASLGNGYGSKETGTSDGQTYASAGTSNVGNGYGYETAQSGAQSNVPSLGNGYGVGGFSSPGAQAYGSSGSSNVGKGYSVSGTSSNAQSQSAADNGNFGNNGYGVAQTNTQPNSASLGNSYGLGSTGSSDGQAYANIGASKVGNGYGYNTAQSNVPSLGNGYGVGGISSPGTQAYATTGASNVGNVYGYDTAQSSAQSNAPSLGNGYGVGGISSPGPQAYGSSDSSNVGNGYSVGGASSNPQSQSAADSSNFENNGYGVAQSNGHSNLASLGNGYGLGATGSSDGQAYANTGASNVGNGYGYDTSQSSAQLNAPSLGNGYGVGGISSPGAQAYATTGTSNAGNGYGAGGASSTGQAQSIAGGEYFGNGGHGIANSGVQGLRNEYGQSKATSLGGVGEAQSQSGNGYGLGNIASQLGLNGFGGLTALQGGHGLHYARSENAGDSEQSSSSVQESDRHHVSGTGHSREYKYQSQKQNQRSNYQSKIEHLIINPVRIYGGRLV